MSNFSQFVLTSEIYFLCFRPKKKVCLPKTLPNYFKYISWCKKRYQLYLQTCVCLSLDPHTFNKTPFLFSKLASEPF